MNPKKLKEILATHADHLVQNRSDPQDFPELSLQGEEELSSLIDVATRVKHALQPVTPTNQFESNLKRQLLTTAHLRQVEGYTAPNPERDLLVLLAIVGFIVSLTGVLLALRLRSQTI